MLISGPGIILSYGMVTRRFLPSPRCINRAFFSGQFRNASSYSFSSVELLCHVGLYVTIIRPIFAFLWLSNIFGSIGKLFGQFPGIHFRII